MSDILVIQHVAPEGIGRIEDSLRKFNLAVEVVRVFAGDPVPAELGRHRALIVMGGPMGVYEQVQYPHLTGELGLIRHAAGAGKAVLGICLGSQLIASALGGTVTPGARKEIGWYPVRVGAEAKADPLFGAVPAEFTALHWHGDVFSVPEGAVPLASSARTACQAFRYGLNVYALLFHLEVDQTAVDGMVETFAEELDAEQLDGAAIRAGGEEHLPALRGIGARVFDAWASMVGR